MSSSNADGAAEKLKLRGLPPKSRRLYITTVLQRTCKEIVQAAPLAGLKDV